MRRFERLKRWVAAMRPNPWHDLRTRPVVRAWRRAKAAMGGTAMMRELCALAWPIAAAMLGETAIGLVDTKLVGGLGAAALGGVGIATIVMYLAYSMVFGLMRGVKVRTAYAVGRGSAEDGVRYAQAGALLGFAAGALVWLATRDIAWALRGLGLDASTVPYGRDFLAARTYGAPATCALAALIQYRQGVGDSRAPMIVGIAGNAVNAVLAYALIYGHFGLPALGVRGAGYGTAIAETLELVTMTALVAREAAGMQRVPGVSLAGALREVASLGVPTGLHFGLETLAFTMFTAIVGSLGAQEIAAHHIALNTIRASFLPGIAVAESASVLVGRALGRGRVAEADRATRAAIAVAVAFMSVCGIAFALFGAAVVGAFTDDPSVSSIARRLLMVAALFQTLDAINMVLRGALRGAKDVRWVMIVGTTVAWVCTPGAALVLGRMAGLGAFGGWWGFVLETALCATLFGWRWSRGPWRRDFAGSRKAEAPSPTAALAAPAS